MELVDGQTYQNKRGDFRGPMRLVAQSHSAGWFVDQYGIQYAPDGVQVNHTNSRTANIDLNTAGTTEGWRDDDEAEFNHACQQEEAERRDEAELYREAEEHRREG